MSTLFHFCLISTKRAARHHLQQSPIGEGRATHRQASCTSLSGKQHLCLTENFFHKRLSSSATSNISPMDAHRVETLRVAVEHIDRHRGDFKELDEQKYMLSDLIKRHQLKYKPVGKPLTDLDVQTYRRAIENIAHRNGTKMKGKDAKITQVFLKGSRVLTKELLEKIGYTHTGSVSDSEQSEYDGDEDTSAETEAQRSRGTTEASTVHNSNIKVGGNELPVQHAKTLQTMESATYPTTTLPST